MLRKILLSALLTFPLLAHHPVAAKFDLNKKRTLRGVVTRVDWSNPHVHVLMYVQESGQRANWAVELESDRHGRAFGLAARLRAFLAVARDARDARVFEHRNVELHGLFGLLVEPQERGDALESVVGQPFSLRSDVSVGLGWTATRLRKLRVTACGAGEESL